MRTKLNAMLAGIGIAMLAASAVPAISQAEDAPTGEVTSAGTEPPVEEPGTLWDKTKEVSADTWDATKEGGARAWDKTREVSGDVWDATRDGSARAWDKTREVSGDVWDKTTDMIQGGEETGPEAEARTPEEKPATSNSP